MDWPEASPSFTNIGKIIPTMYELKGNPVSLSPDLFTKALNRSDLKGVLMLPTNGITQACFHSNEKRSKVDMP